MTEPTKSLGQIASEASPRAAVNDDWRDMTEERKSMWERIAAAVALECSRICTEIAAEHMRKAQEGVPGDAADFRQQAALECAEAIREAIK